MQRTFILSNPRKKTTENQGKEISDCKSNEIRNVIQWAASGTKKREKEKPEVDGADKIFMISNGIEEEKELSLKEENSCHNICIKHQAQRIELR